MKLADDKKLGDIVTLELDKDIVRKEKGDFEQSNRNGMVFNMQVHILTD